jgi:hypothetical protein
VEQERFEPLVPREFDRRILRERDQGFESLSLHRRVCLTSAFHGCSRKDPAFVYGPRSRSDIQADLRNVRERTAWPLRHRADLSYKRMA